MAVGAMLAALALGVLRFVGRWVLRRIGAVGRRRILEYMSERIDRLYEKKRDADTIRRRRWLDFRITNWIRARDWIKDHFWRLTKRAARKVEEALQDKLADRVPHETYETWTPEAA